MTTEVSKKRPESFLTFGEPSLDKAAQRVDEFIDAILRNPYGLGYTLTLLGRPGVGKTMLAREIFRALGLDAWGNLSKIHPKIKDGAFLNRNAVFSGYRKLGDDLKSGEWDRLDELESPLLLCLDDLGAGYDPNYMIATKADRLLRRRQRKWNIVTSNFDLVKLGELLDYRISSFLIRDGNKTVLLKGRDFATRPNVKIQPARGSADQCGTTQTHGPDPDGPSDPAEFLRSL